ncbi:MAG: ATP-binding protein [Candidatus Promineifilaceae bacterium]|nr:ATP-binding protein [Candidatus Promineifilaceae bacterium]
MTAVVSPTSSDVAALAERLLHELAGIMDAHGVCAVATDVLASGLNRKVVAVLADRQRRHFDVWICAPDGQTKQTRWSSTEPVLTRLTASPQIVRLDREDVPSSELVDSRLWGPEIGSLLAVSLPIPHVLDEVSLPGALIVVDPPTDSILSADQWATVGKQVSAFLDRALLRRRADQLSIEFGIITDISYSITSTLDLQEIFLEVTDAVRRALGAESISVGLLEPDEDTLVFINELMGPLFRDLPPVRIEVGQGIAGWVAEHGEPTVVNDPYDDSRFYARVDEDTGFRTTSIICVPLKVEQRVIGVLEAINKANGLFDDGDMRLLQAISGPLAIAIDNARLHERALAEKRRVETMFASMSEGVLTTTSSGIITAANDSSRALLRAKENEIIGKHLKTVLTASAADLDQFVSIVRETDDNYPQLVCEAVQSGGSSNQAPVLVSGAAVRQESGHAEELVFVLSDLSMIREIERMREDFFNAIIHELHTPLATILMYARLLREGKTANDAHRTQRFLGVIERESDRLQQMVRQLLQLARLESSEFSRSAESVSLAAVLEQVLPPMADRAVEKGLVFRQNIPDELPHVVATEDGLYLILRNLLDNSIKFTYAGTVSLSAKIGEDHVNLVISDQGIGIPSEALPNLYQRFYRAHSAVERGIAGSGLGLYMVKETLKAHNGTIAISSHEGQGTEVVVTLPRARD